MKNVFRHNYDGEKTSRSNTATANAFVSREVLRYERRKETKCKDVGNNRRKATRANRKKTSERLHAKRGNGIRNVIVRNKFNVKMFLDNEWSYHYRSVFFFFNVFFKYVFLNISRCN